MPLDFNSFFNAIAQQESGGNYSAINGSSGALGKYQIMPSNVPAWSEKYLGVRWSPGQFLADPRKQDTLAHAVLQDYFNRYGARGAAAAWYSGNPANANNYRPQSGGYPSIGSYVDQVLGRVGSGGSGTGSARTSPLSTNINVTDNTVKAPVVPQAPNDGGVGAATAPGAEQVTGAGAGAVGAPGAQAVGAAGVAPERPSAPRPQQPKAADQQVPDYWKGLVNQPGGITLHGAQGRQAGIVAGLKMIGLPYVWGGGGSNGPSRSSIAHGNFQDVGFDCSGLIQYILGQAGIQAPRLSYDQLKMGPRVALNALHPGDLVGFRDGGHIALYLGNGEILEAPSTGKNVRQRALGPNENAWGVSLQALYN